jgi:hypothetical protein
MRELELEQVNDTVRLRWTFPAKLIALLVAGGAEGAPEPAP